MSCEICGHTEGQHLFNEDGSTQGSFYSCTAPVKGTEDGKCDCIEYQEPDLDSDDDE